MCYALYEKKEVGCPVYWGKVKVSQPYFEEYKKLLSNKKFDIFCGDKYSMMTSLMLGGYAITEKEYEKYDEAPYHDKKNVIEPYVIKEKALMQKQLYSHEPLYVLTNDRKYERDFEFDGYGSSKGYYFVSEVFRGLLNETGMEEGWTFIDVNIINRKTEKLITSKKYYYGLAPFFEKISNDIIDLEQTIFQYDGQKRILGTYDEVQAALEDEREQKIARAGVLPSFYDIKFKSTPKTPPLFIIEDFPQTGGNCFALYCSEAFHDEMKRRKIKGIEALPLSEMKNIDFVDTERD